MNFVPLSSLYQLKQLNLNFTNIVDLSVLKNLRFLEFLGVQGCVISDFATLPPLPCLVNLDASKTPLLSLKNLEKQPKLKNVNLRDCVQLTDLSAMSKMRSLSSVLMLPDFD